MPHFYLLGQSNFGISVLVDCLSCLFPDERIQADIIANLPPEQNTSLAYAYEAPGVQSTVHHWQNWAPEAAIPCLIGSIGKGRRAIFEFFQAHFQIDEQRYYTTIHPSAVVSKSVEMGRGNHISPLSVVAPHARLDDFVVINRNASVGHHTVLERFATVNPGANVAGACRIGEGVTIGAGATVIDQITIGEGSVIGAGSVVTKDIPAGVIAFGSPAKVIREVS